MAVQDDRMQQANVLHVLTYLPGQPGHLATPPSKAQASAEGAALKLKDTAQQRREARHSTADHAINMPPGMSGV
eukprot:357773-Chlamydomonas_euryale.AAC.12